VAKRIAYSLKLMHNGLIDTHVLKVAADVGDHVVNDEPVNRSLISKSTKKKKKKTSEVVELRWFMDRSHSGD
jgi:hypothetical protein